jgi:hypothetical protein
MGVYYKLNNKNIVENIILAEQDFIDSQPDKEKYIKQFRTYEEEQEAKTNSIYALNFGNIGTFYNFEKRKFKNIQPYKSWIWNEEKYEWESPIPKPNKDFVLWNEDTQNWVDVNPETGEFIK